MEAPFDGLLISDGVFISFVLLNTLLFRFFQVVGIHLFFFLGCFSLGWFFLLFHRLYTPFIRIFMRLQSIIFFSFLDFFSRVSGIGTGSPQHVLLCSSTNGSISFIIVSSVGWGLFMGSTYRLKRSNIFLQLGSHHLIFLSYQLA